MKAIRLLEKSGEADAEQVALADELEARLGIRELLPGNVPSVSCSVLCAPCCVTTATLTVVPGFSSDRALVRSSTVVVEWPLTARITSPDASPAFAAGPPAVTLWT